MAATFGLLINANVKGENNIKRLGNSMQGVQGKVKNLKMAVGGLSAAFATLGASVAVGGFTRFLKTSIDQADAFGKLSTRTGIAANELQAFVNAGKLADVSQKQLETGLKSFARTSFEAGQGVKTYSQAYAALGINVKKSDGSLRASDELLKDIADKFADLPNGPEKAAIAMRIFGKSGADMITLLNGGRAALEKFNYEISDNFAQNAEFFNDQITELQINFNGFRMQLMDQLLPTLNNIILVFKDIFNTESSWNGLFMAIDIGIRSLAMGLLVLIKPVEIFAKSMAAAAEMMDAISKGEFFKAAEIYGKRFVGMFQDIGAGISQLGQLATGRFEARTDYGGGRGVSTITMPSTTEGKEKKKKDKKAAKERQAAEAKVLDQFNEFLKAELPLGTLQEFVARATDELNDLQTIAVNISQGIGNAIGNSISRGLQGLIEGTKNAQQVFADFLKSVGDILLQEGTKMIATYIAIGIAKAFAGLASGGGGGGGTSYSGGEVSGALSPSLTGVEGLKGDYFPTSTFFKPYAKGGFVSRPTNALIGEAGNEYVIPAQKMRTAMQRYQSGIRGPGVISDTDQVMEQGFSAAATNAPIDVRYTVERINNVDYVTADQFQAGMRQAAQQGAAEGERRTMRSLKNSASTRRGIGLA